VVQSATVVKGGKKGMAMKVMVFGATGMVGAGVLRECLLDAGVERVLTVGRHATGERNEKLRETVTADLLDLTAIEGELGGYDACFYCMGVSSVGMTEAEYRRVSYAMPMAAAEMLVKLNPAMTFVYVTGAGCDRSERGPVMWARVKGATENALLRMPFKGMYMFRPAAIQPLHGIRSKTRLYQFFYDALGPLLTLGTRWLPQYVTTTEQVGKAMLRMARQGGGRGVVENGEINQA
jgi:uncharacterized protein YbjT (DUF2867 family)